METANKPTRIALRCTQNGRIIESQKRGVCSGYLSGQSRFAGLTRTGKQYDPSIGNLITNALLNPARVHG